MKKVRIGLLFLLVLFVFISIAGLKKISLPFQRILVKKALWEAKKVCEKTDNVESALWATMPQFVIAHTLKETSTHELIINFMDKNNDREFRYLCMESFYGPEDSAAVRPLITVMMDSTDKLRGQACKILGLIKDKRAVEPMIELYNRGEARKDVVWSLGVIGDKRAFDVLMDGLKNGDNILKSYCVIALGGIKDERAVPILIEMLEAEEEIWVSDAYGGLNPAIMITLGDIGDPRAVPVLKKMLNQEDNYYQYQAAKALGNIGDKDALEDLISLAEQGELEALKAIGKIGGDEAVEMLERLKVKFKSIQSSYFQKCLDDALKEAKEE